MKVTIWTLTTDDDSYGTVTSAFATEQEVYTCLRRNFDAEGEFAHLDDGALLEELTARQGVIIYVDSPVVELPTPAIEVLHYRDPDSECYLDIWVDGVKVDTFIEEDVDPGRGYTAENWAERLEDLRREDLCYTEPFRLAALAAVETASESKWNL